MLKWRKHLGEDRRNDAACLGVISYSLVLDDIAKHSNHYSGSKAEELLQRMQLEGKVDPMHFATTWSLMHGLEVGKEVRITELQQEIW
eukprot:2498996-Ditylum_brightwellii.AAC.1